MATIEYYDGLIRNARVEIDECKGLIVKKEEEIDNCNNLINSLSRLESAAVNCSNELNNTYNQLSKGLSGDFTIIQTRAKAIKELATNAGTGIGNAKNRITVLENDIIDLKAKINTLNSNIASWEDAKHRLWVQIQSWLASQKKKKSSK